MSKLFRLRHWPIWLGVLCLRFLTLFPYRLQLRTGRLLGRLLMRYGHKARYITEVNLKLCFPELSAKEQKKLLIKNYESVGMGMIEAAMAWWGNTDKLLPLLHIQGLEHLKSALAQGNGVIFLCAHFSILELAGCLLAKRLTFSVVYRPQKNIVFDYLMYKYRSRIYEHVIPREDLRQFIQQLKANKILWYTPDVDGGAKNSIFVPFFGIKTASLTTTARLAAMTNAAVIPIIGYRRDNETGYDIEISPPLENFPSNNLEQDTFRINHILETAIKRKPEQYLWQYKRFKTRPPGEDRFYKK